MVGSTGPSDIGAHLIYTMCDVSAATVVLNVATLHLAQYFDKDNTSNCLSVNDVSATVSVDMGVEHIPLCSKSAPAYSE